MIDLIGWFHVIPVVSGKNRDKGYVLDNASVQLYKLTTMVKNGSFITSQWVVVSSWWHGKFVLAIFLLGREKSLYDEGSTSSRQNGKPIERVVAYPGNGND